MRKKTIKIGLFTLIVGVNIFGLFNVIQSRADVQEMKGMLGQFQGLQVCHCPDDKGNCICRITPGV